MLTSQRKAALLSLMERDGRIVAKEAAEAMGVSEDTIRRDLRELAADGRLTRVHGGALPISPALAGFEDRRAISPAGKVAIGRAAAARVTAGSLTFLDGGTTAIEVARHLPRDLAATIVTHSPHVAIELGAHRALEVILLGGPLFRHSMVTIGVRTLDDIRRFKPDRFFMGVTGVHPDAGLTTGHAEDAYVKAAMAAEATETIVLASAEKIGAASPHLIAPARVATTVITDHADARAILDPIAVMGVEIVRVAAA